MISRITFLNDHLIVPVFLGALLLLLIYIGKELSQAGRRRIILKIFLILLTILSLGLIALEPAFPSKETTGNYVLLTKNYNEDQLDSLQQEYKRLKQVNYLPGESLPKMSSAEKVFILGRGVKEYDLWQLEQLPAEYLGGSHPEGVVKIQFPEGKKIGDSLLLKGFYNNPQPGNRLVLQGPGGGGLDSLVFNSEEDLEFELAAELKAPGNFVYSLAEKDSLGKLLSSDPVPVKVAEKVNLRILIINSFPTFETRYLKNYLAEAGHELVVRSQITRGRFKFEFFNTSRSNIGTLSETSLAPFDLLIIDAASLNNLPKGQATAVRNAVREEGLGIFIQPEEAFFRSPGDFFKETFGSLQDSGSLSYGTNINIERFPFEFKEAGDLHTIQSKNAEVISAYKREGRGRIGTTVLADTWQLILDGHKDTYRHLWANLVEQLSKKKDLAAELERDSEIAFLNEPLHFKLRTLLPNPGIRTGKGNMIPLKEDVNISSLWIGTTWPGEAGWNSLHLDTIAQFDYYVFPDAAWNSVTAVETGTANSKYFNRRIEVGQREIPPEPVNPLWFFGLFLIGMGGLWLEPKI